MLYPIVNTLILILLKQAVSFDTIDCLPLLRTLSWNHFLDTVLSCFSFSEAFSFLAVIFKFMSTYKLRYTKTFGGALMTQLANQLTFDFLAGHYLMACEMEPCKRWMHLHLSWNSPWCTALKTSKFHKDANVGAKKMKKYNDWVTNSCANQGSPGLFNFYF